ncbi:MAG: hypothetical protein WC481_00780 [Candidatus Omnitrophota bacterium]
MKRLSVRFLAVCVMFGASYLISPGLAVCILLSSVFFYAIRRNTGEEDRRFVLFVLSVAILIRAATLITLQYKCISMNQLDIFGDAQDNIIQGINISESIRHIRDIPVTFQSILSSRYNTHSMTIFNGMYFLLLGNDIVSLKYINVLAICATAWLAYDIAKKIYSSTAGRIALMIVLFWPTSFLWSVTDLKESHLLFAITCSFWLLYKAESEKGVLRKMALTGMSVLFASYFVLLKVKLMMPIFVLSVALIALHRILYYGFSKNAALSRKMLYLSVIPLTVIFISFGGWIQQAIREMYALIIHYHIGFLNSGGWNIDLIGDQAQNHFTIQFIISYISKAWLFFLFEPLPWHFYSFSLMVTYPMMIAWYIIVAYSVIGIGRIYYTGKTKKIFAMIVFTVIYVTVVGMSVANIGTLIRFRDVIVPIVAVFAGIGLSGVSRAKEERCRNIR